MPGLSRSAIARTILSAVLCFFVTAGSAEGEGETKPDFPKIPPVVDSIPVKPGDRWTYRWIDEPTSTSSPFDSIGASIPSTRSARCSESPEAQQRRPSTNSTPGNGHTPHLVGVGNNRIGKE